MKSTAAHLEELFVRYPALTDCQSAILAACQHLTTVAQQNGTLLLCGNGGSYADCEHISGELLKGFLSKRPLDATDKARFPDESMLGSQLQYGIRAIPFPSLSAVMTAFNNDVSPAAVYAQLVWALGRSDDALLCISTSGNAENVCNAAIAAKACGISVIGLTGQNGGRIQTLADVCIAVPETETYRVQELHLPVYHAICAYLEAELFGATL